MDPRFTVRYDTPRGSWGVYDRATERFVGHTGTEHGARAMRRRMRDHER